MAAHKMRDGRWCVWLNLGSDPMTGRRLRKRVEARTRREAESKATAMRERHQRGEDVTRKPRTLGELLDEYLATVEHQGKTANTLITYRGASKNHLRPHLGGVDVTKLRTREIQNVFNDLAKRLAPTNIRLIKTVLVQALNLAIEQNEITINPAEKVRIPIVKRKPGRSLTPEEVRAVRAACEGHRYGLAIQLALMGLRRSELPGLMWDDFDEQAGTLIIQRQIQRDPRKKQWVPVAPKDDSTRMLALGPKMTAALRQYRWRMAEERDVMEWPNSGYIFVSVRTGGICPPSTIYEAFRAIALMAGIERARLHDCRHTAATKLLSEGEDIATVAEVLGHASPQITAMIYAHALPHKVAGASKRLEDLYE
jgi:integrase